MTKDFSYATMDVGIAYREDVDEVIETLKGIGAEMEADEAINRNLLGPLEILGLDRFGDSAVVIKCRIKTKPIMQWSVRREFNRRMKRRFDELGIEIPFPHTTVYFGEDKAGRAPAATVRLFESTAEEGPPAAPRPTPDAGTRATPVSAPTADDSLAPEERDAERAKLADEKRD